MQEIIIQPSSQPTKVTIKDPEVIVSTTDVPNVPPTLTATASSPTLPDGKILLNATANDVDGSIKRILWSTTNAKAVISDPTKEDTFATVTTVGTYVFRVEVEDDKGYIVFMNVTSIVAAAANTLPSVNAGSDLTIIAPASTAQLNGTGSDAEGGVSFMWSKVSGSGTLVNPNQAVASVTGLTVGVSVFRLTVTDSSGATRTDDVNITVQSSTVPGQTFNFSFSPLGTDYTRPFSGAEIWVGNQWNTNIPNVTKLDEYDRFGGGQLETSNGVYNLKPITDKIKACIDRGGKFAFGIMTFFPGAQVGYKEVIRLSDGTVCCYPQYLHDQMQGSSLKDWKVDNTWVPNWNSDFYLSWWERLNKAIYKELNETTYKGIKLKEAVNYIDLRGFGEFGEWHMYFEHGDEPANLRETEPSLRRIIEAQRTAYPDIQLVALSDGFLPNNNNYVPAAISYLLLTGNNNVGEFGWRHDHVGSDLYPESFKYEGINTVVNGQRLGDLVANKWRVAPIVGEPHMSSTYRNLPAEVQRYHFNSFGNGNYSPSSTITPNIVNASKLSGARVGILSGTLTTNTGALAITINWNNTGLAPVYELFDVLIELRQGATVAKSLKTTVNLKTLLPGTKGSTDSFSGIPSGTYDVYVVIKNSLRQLPLNQAGNKSGYLLKSGVVL